VPPEIQVKQPSVNVKVAPEPPPVSGVAETVPLGKTVYAPGSVTDTIAVTLLPETVAVNFAGVPVPPTTVNVRVPFV
jgi:hypothetical protein